MSSELLFVYGTLRRPFVRHSLLQSLGARFVAKGSICGLLYDLGEFPGAVKVNHNAPHMREFEVKLAAENTKAPAAEPRYSALPSYHDRRPSIITGEVFRLSNPERAFKTLDAYEGARS